MVTKLSDTVVDTVYERQFRYLSTESSGLSFVMDAGQLMETSGLVEFPKQTITLVDDTSQHILINFDVNPAQVVRQTTITADKYLLLYEIATASGVISTVDDCRWKGVTGRLIRSSFNVIDDFLDANAHIYYPMRETSTAYVDALSNGPNLVPVLASSVDFGYPGLTRGTPRHGAVITYSSTATPQVVIGSGGIAANTWTEGGLGALTFIPDLGGLDDFVLIFQNYVDSTADYVKLVVEPSGRILFRTQFGSQFIQTVSNTGIVTDGEVCSILAMQNNDGNGVRLYKDGVDVTFTQTRQTGLVADDFVSDAAAADSAGTAANDLYIGRDMSDANRHLTSIPCFFTTGFGATKALEYHNAHNIDGQPSDLAELIMKEFAIGNTDGHAILGGATTADARVFSLGPGRDQPQHSTATPALFETSLLTSEYSIKQMDFENAGGTPPFVRDTSVQKDFDMGPYTTNLTGTYVMVCRPGSAAAADSNQYMVNYSGGEFSFATISLAGWALYWVGNDTNLTLYLMAFTGTTGSVFRIGNANEFSPDTTYDIVITQDGTGMEAWVNHVSKTLTVTQTKNSTDWANEWIGDVIDDSPASWTYYIGRGEVVSGAAQDFEGIVLFEGFTENGNVWDSTMRDEWQDALNSAGFYA